MCTDFIVGTAQSGFVTGRSMEFALELAGRLYFIRKGHAFGASGDRYQFQWEADHNIVAMNTAGMPLISDGMNDKGLSCGSLWLPGSEYQTPTDPKRALSVDRFAMYLLSKFDTVANVKKELSKSTAVQVAGPEFIQELLPLHFALHDATGASLVIEFLGGEMKLFDNPIGTLTNQPPLPWQLENLRNYVNLSPWDAEDSDIRGETVTQTGHGSGMLGLPGDPTPPGRFVRATMMANYAFPPETTDQAVSLVYHIMNAVDLPRGLVQAIDKTTGGEETDYTQWIAVKDMERKIFSVRMYETPQAYSVDLLALSEEDWTALDGKQVAVPTAPVTVDLSGETVLGLKGGLVAHAEDTLTLDRIRRSDLAAA